MKKCSNCNCNSSWKCIPCTQLFCHGHKKSHIKATNHDILKLKYLSKKYPSTPSQTIIESQSTLSYPYAGAYSKIWQSLQQAKPDSSLAQDSLTSDPNSSSNYLSEEFIRERYGLFIEGHIDSILSIAISADSKYIVSGSADATLRVWSIEHNRQEGILAGHLSYIHSIAITKNSKKLKKE